MAGLPGVGAAAPKLIRLMIESRSTARKCIVNDTGFADVQKFLER